MPVVNSSRIVWAVGLLSATMACSNGSISSPTRPSASDGPAALTTIKGTAQDPSATQTASAQARHASTSVQICVSGTTTCTTVGTTGNFELAGNFSGDVRLQITGSEGTVILTIPGVERGETIVVLLNLNDTGASLRIVSRTGEDDGEDDGDDQGDDDQGDHDGHDDDGHHDDDDHNGDHGSDIER